MTELDKSLQGNVSEDDYLEMVRVKGRRPDNPIGSCFDSAAHQVLWDKMPQYTSVRLCHGVIIANAPGSKGKHCPHAWIEAVAFGGKKVVLDTIWGEEIPKAVFYDIFKPYFVYTYRKPKVLSMWAQFDHPGPWAPKLIEKFKELNEEESVVIDSLGGQHEVRV